MREKIAEGYNKEIHGQNSNEEADESGDQNRRQNG